MSVLHWGDALGDRRRVIKFYSMVQLFDESITRSVAFGPCAFHVGLRYKRHRDTQTNNHASLSGSKKSICPEREICFGCNRNTSILDKQSIVDCRMGSVNSAAWYPLDPRRRCMLMSRIHQIIFIIQVTMSSLPQYLFCVALPWSHVLTSTGVLSSRVVEIVVKELRCLHSLLCSFCTTVHMGVWGLFG